MSIPIRFWKIDYLNRIQAELNLRGFYVSSDGISPDTQSAVCICIKENDQLRISCVKNSSLDAFIDHVRMVDVWTTKSTLDADLKRMSLLGP